MNDFQILTKIILGFQSSARCKLRHRSSGMLRGVDRELVTDVSVQLLGPIAQSHAA